MNEYALSVFAVAATVSLLTAVVHPTSRRGVGVALSVLVAYTVLTPLPELFSEAGENILVPSQFEQDLENGCETVMSEAFAEGVRRLVCESFSLDSDDVRVEVVGFNTGSVSAERILVVLSGRAVTADYKGIERLITDEGLGQATVELAW